MATFNPLKRYSKGGFWSIFVFAAFPLHIWAIIMVLRDLSWIAERSNAWDAIGVGSYTMLLTFLESLMVGLVASFLGYLLPARWIPKKQVAVLGVLILVTVFWGVIGQSYILFDISPPPVIVRFLVNRVHPLRVLYIVVLLFVVPTIGLPLFFAAKSEHVQNFMMNLAKRIAVLVQLYLLVDFFGLMIAVIRNI